MLIWMLYMINIRFVLKYRPTEIIEPYGQVPASKSSFEEAEQATAFSYACSTQTIRPPLKPVSTVDLQYALKVTIEKVLFFSVHHVSSLHHIEITYFIFPNRFIKISLAIIPYMLLIWSDCIHMLLIQRGKIWRQNSYYVNHQHKKFLFLALYILHSSLIIF